MALTIITGKKDSGKTSRILDTYSGRAGGFALKKVFINGKRVGYDLIVLKSGQSIPCFRSRESCSEPPFSSYAEFKGFYINHEALVFGNSLIQEDLKSCETVVLDEVGIFELSGKGFSEGFNHLIKENSDTEIIVVIQKRALSGLLQHYSLKDAAILSS